MNINELFNLCQSNSFSIKIFTWENYEWIPFSKIKNEIYIKICKTNVRGTENCVIYRIENGNGHS